MKRFLKIIGVLVALILVLAVVGFIYMDSIATATVEKATAFATECDVEIDKVDVRPLKGQAIITGMYIKNPDMQGDNPEGFREVHENFLHLETGGGEVSLGTLRSDEVVVPEVAIDGVTISLIGRDGKTNYQTLLASLKRLQGEEEQEDPSAEETGGKTFTISVVTIDNVRVWVDMDEDPVLGLAPVQFDEPLTIKPIKLTDVGQGGVPLSQISADLIADILIQVVAQLGDQLGDRILSGLTSGLAGIVGEGELQEMLPDIDVSKQIAKAEELYDATAEAIGDITEGAGDLIDDIGGNIGGFLGGNDED